MTYCDRTISFATLIYGMNASSMSKFISEKRRKSLPLFNELQGESKKVISFIGLCNKKYATDIQN